MRYVLAVYDYLTRETSLLSFPAGAVIRLEDKEGLDKGIYVYSIISVHFTGSLPFFLTIGWLYGEYEGNSGSFPVEYTVPVVCVKEEPTTAALEVAGLSLDLYAA